MLGKHFSYMRLDGMVRSEIAGYTTNTFVLSRLSMNDFLFLAMTLIGRCHLIFTSK